MPSPRPRPSAGTLASHFGVLIGISVVMGVLVAGLAIPAVTALGYGTREASNSLKNLPLSLRSEPLAERTRVEDASGRTIATFFDQNRVDVPMSQIAPIMRRAIVAIEDSRFFEHGALDLKGTLRALLTNQADGGTTQGGSSIAQQLAKMTALDQATTAAGRRAATAETYARKFTELRHAIAFEQHYSKTWILNRYLNIAYFGSGAYGIESAAEHYFSVPAKDLSLPQAALLAGLVKNPTGYDPTLNPSAAKQRRGTVLMRMAQLGVISNAQAQKYYSAPLGLKVKPFPNGCIGSKAPLFCSYVYRYLLLDPSLGKTQAERAALINSGGLTIKTTMRPRFQTAATSAVRQSVFPTEEAIGALSMVQPGTGNVFAIAQSRPMGRNKQRGQTFLNYAVDTKYGDAAGFQPGSTFKLFVLSAALTQGLPPTTSFYSPPEINIPQNDYRTCNGMYTTTSNYPVHNSTTSGTKTMITGMQQSVNTYFAQLEKQTGLCQPFRLAQRMGITLNDPNSEMVPSFTLGVANANPLQMAAAYATMPARGIFCSPRPVTAIYNSAGKIFKTYPKQCTRVVSPAVADEVNSILSGVMGPGGFGAALTLDKPSAGKTGTSENNRSVWFNGYTPTVSTSVVVAGANRQGHWISLNPLPIGGIYHGTAHGSTVAGPIWALAMRAIQDRIADESFVAPPPSPLSAGLPGVEGQSVATAEEAIRAAGFTPALAGTVDSSALVGSVAKLSLGVDNNTVYIYTSTGHGPVAVAPTYSSSPVVRNPRGGTGGGGGGGRGGGHRGGGPVH